MPLRNKTLPPNENNRSTAALSLCSRKYIVSWYMDMVRDCMDLLRYWFWKCHKMSQYESNNFLTSCTSTPLYPVQLNIDVWILILIFIDSMIPTNYSSFSSSVILHYTKMKSVGGTPARGPGGALIAPQRGLGQSPKHWLGDRGSVLSSPSRRLILVSFRGILAFWSTFIGKCIILYCT